MKQSALWYETAAEARAAAGGQNVDDDDDVNTAAQPAAAATPDATASANDMRVRALTRSSLSLSSDFEPVHQIV